MLATRGHLAKTPESPISKRYAARSVAGLPEYLERDEVEGVARCAPHMRAGLIILEMWRAGLRISEAVALEVSDIHLDEVSPTLRVRKGKGNRPRVVPVHPELAGALRTTMDFGGKKRGRLVECHRSTAWTWVKKAVASAIERGYLAPDRLVTPHTFRHSAARHWLANGIPINVVQRWLGHKRLQTTLIYLEILPDQLGLMERVP
ncbi:MAG: site-specific integrase [Chloroflexota bacterium]